MGGEMLRTAIVFDDRHRPETTGVYCRRALDELVHDGLIASATHCSPHQLSMIGHEAFDLFVFIDDGLAYPIPEQCRPAVWWAIDTHLNFDRSLEKARSADWIFAAQRDGAERLRECSVAAASWLPLACDPGIHGRQKVANQYDIAFIGHVFPGPRRDLLQSLQARYPRTLVGQHYFEEMARRYSASHVVFNRSIQNDINMRVFEALCSGSLLVTNDLSENGLAELFRDGEHLVNYACEEELHDKLTFYLAHSELRGRIARAGREEVLAKHTYRHRMETILKLVRRNPAGRRTVQTPVVRPEMTMKGRDYFEFDRPDVLALIPTSAKRVLDVGCGRGRLGAALKGRQSVHVTGIELDAASAVLAKARLDEVYEASIEDPRIEFEPGTFDCIVCADVLEHLRSPDAMLRRLRQWVSDDGCLVTSLPNVRNHTVIRSLLAGNWTYEAAGLLDADHVRFFTRREIEKLLVRAGFQIEEARFVAGEGYDDWCRADQPREITVGGLGIRAASTADASEFFAYQYLMRSRPHPACDYGLTSIILVTHNQSAYTKACIESIRLRTDEAYELIVVDNGSTDETLDSLRSMSGVVLIDNDTNRGFPAAANQGIASAKGDNILLLNNDTLVTTGWLRRMLAALHSCEDIGLVGPVSNRVSGEQQVEVGYGHVNELDGFAWDWGRDHDEQRIETDRLVGFCLLFKRSVVDRIGLLDERFGVGNFEDDDFCRRARAAGFRMVIAMDSFVHHFGHVTFQGSGANLGQILERNQRLYRQKWSDGFSPSTSSEAHDSVMNPRVSRPRPQFVITQGTGDGLLLEPNQVKLSVCLIVRDNENTIRPCLESIRPWVDEMVVIDTGSTDRTPTICEEFGARVFHWAWQDSFAAARNVSFDHARGEWLFWMDSDDTIPEECGRKLRELAEGPHEESILGYVMQVHCPGADPNDLTVVDHVKLVRNRPDLRFEFRIHEQILPAIRRASGDVAFTDIHVVHSGSDHSLETRGRKLARDFRLLELEYSDRPDHPFVLFNLGMTHADAHQHQEAVQYLIRCIDVSQPSESHLRKAYALLVSSLSQLSRAIEADHRCDEGLRLFPQDKELQFRKAMLHHSAGRLDEAASTYLRVLTEPEDRHFTSVDAGITGLKSRHNLALVYEDQGRTSKAQELWNTILEQHPDYSAAWCSLTNIFLQRGEAIQAKKLLSRARSEGNGTYIASVIASRIAEFEEHYTSAIDELASAVKACPEDLYARNELCRLLFVHGSDDQAEEALRALVTLCPSDGAARYNLALVLERQGKTEAAVEQLRDSLAVRPGSRLAHERLRSLLGSIQSPFGQNEIAESGQYFSKALSM
jgi:O-antigen biosynthesis protein